MNEENLRDIVLVAGNPSAQERSENQQRPIICIEEEMFTYRKGHIVLLSLLGLLNAAVFFLEFYGGKTCSFLLSFNFEESFSSAVF